MQLTDTHCHLDMAQFDADRDEVLDRAWQAGLTRILVPGLSIESSRAAVRLAECHPQIVAAIGIHPNESLSWNSEAVGTLHEISLSREVVSIGEIGLDYYWDSTPHPLQQKALREQLSLAEELELPVVVHFREKGDAAIGACTSDLMLILEEWSAGLKRAGNSLAERPGVLHSFSGSLEMAQSAVDLGFSIGISGSITYKNAGLKLQILAAIPLTRILLETDAPFQAPVPHRGKRNEPACVRLIADKIALVHSCTSEQVANATSENARRLFAWD